VHAFAGSRAGFKSIIVVKELNAAGTKTITDGVMVYDGHLTDPTIEGPKLYKRNNYYYIFAPAGGVSTGWQLVLRSANIYGPYERKVVMSQGGSSVNGPHQGAWVSTRLREDWFLHFQDKEAYGRVVHLQPMKWIKDWPVIGVDVKGNGNGEPQLKYKKPLSFTSTSAVTVADSDEFNTARLGLQWQWPANPQSGWAFPTALGFLRMNCFMVPDSLKNYWNLPALLMQKFSAENFTVTTRLTLHPAFVNDRAGLLVFGSDYAHISLVKKDSGNFITLNTALRADKNQPEREVVIKKVLSDSIYFRVSVRDAASCTFSYSEDGVSFTKVPIDFQAKPGKWVGARIGFSCTGTAKTNDAGSVDIDWIRFTK
jgi:beta-xylosidase